MKKQPGPTFEGLDLTRSLEQLEGRKWGDPPDGSTALVARCHATRRIPIGELSVEDLRLLICQRIGWAYLMPLAVKELEADLLVEGDLYPGDLLVAVLQVDRVYWEGNVGLWEKVHSTFRQNESRLQETEKDIRKVVQRQWEAFANATK